MSPRISEARLLSQLGQDSTPFDIRREFLPRDGEVEQSRELTYRWGLGAGHQHEILRTPLGFRPTSLVRGCGLVAASGEHGEVAIAYAGTQNDWSV